MGTAAACGTVLTLPVATPPTTVPTGQPGASPPPSAPRLTAGNHTVTKQRQVAAGNNITRRADLTGASSPGTALPLNSRASPPGHHVRDACARCGREVRVNRDSYDIFERMHYACSDYEFEHTGFDPDEECDAGGCPSSLFTARPSASDSAS